MAGSENIIDDLSNLTVLDDETLRSILESKWGLSAAQWPNFQPTIPEKDTLFYTVVLTELGKRRIEVIKEVRHITQLGLKESKDLVDSIPRGIIGATDEKQILSVARRLTSVGASISIDVFDGVNSILVPFDSTFHDRRALLFLSNEEWEQAKILAQEIINPLQLGSPDEHLRRIEQLLKSVEDANAL